jgi:hypothetical protein
MSIPLNKPFDDWYDSLAYGEPSYQEAFEAGWNAAFERAIEIVQFNGGSVEIDVQIREEKK